MGFNNQNVTSAENSLIASVELPVSQEVFVRDPLTNHEPGFSSTLASSSASTLVQHHIPRQKKTGASKLRRPVVDVVYITTGDFVKVDSDTFSQGIPYDAETFKVIFPNAWLMLGDVCVNVWNVINVQVGSRDRKKLRSSASIFVTENMILLIAFQQPIEKGQLPFIM